VGKAKQLTEESLEEVTSSLRTVESALEAFRPRLLTLHRCGALHRIQYSKV